MVFLRKQVGCWLFLLKISALPLIRVKMRRQEPHGEKCNLDDCCSFNTTLNGMALCNLSATAVSSSHSNLSMQTFPQLPFESKMFIWQTCSSWILEGNLALKNISEHCVRVEIKDHVSHACFPGSFLWGVFFFLKKLDWCLQMERGLVTANSESRETHKRPWQ